MALEEQLSVKDVAKLLGVHPQTVYRLSQDPEGPPSYRFGDRLMFDSDRLKKWIDAGGTRNESQTVGQRPPKAQPRVSAEKEADRDLA